jgi:chromosome partitioning protein
MIIALVGQKGGSGKTTLTSNLAPELLARGRRLLLVDVDHQGSASTWADKAARAGRPAPAIAVVRGIDRGRFVYDEDAVAGWLTQALPSLARDFDDVLIDCPGGRFAVQAAALKVANIALVPTAEDGFSAWSLAMTAEMIRNVRAKRPALMVFGLVSRVDMRRRIAEQAREHIAAVGLPALKTEIRDRTEFVEAVGFLLGASTYQPRSEAAAEVRALVDELQAIWRRRDAEEDAGGKARKAARADVRQHA